MPQGFFNQPISNIVAESDPITCTSSTVIRDVIKIFQDKKIGCIVISEDGKRVDGIFTERDIIQKVLKEEGNLDRPISDFMVKKPVCIYITDPISRAIVLMRIGRFRHICVLNRGGDLAQIISVKDIIDYINDTLGLNVG